MSAHDPTARQRGARIDACADAISSYLDQQMDALMHSARDALLKGTAEQHDPADEERRVVVVEEIQGLLPQVAKRFRAGILGGLVTETHTEVPGEPGGGDAERLSLVETRRVDDWLRMRRILGRQSSDARALESALWERLAAAAGLPADPDDSPVSVQGMCVHFQEALQDVRSSRAARAAIYDAFEDTVIKRLGGLVVALNAALDGA